MRSSSGPPPGWGDALLAEETGISETLILRWVNHVDLIRINGIREQYAKLLEAAGVDSIVELALRAPENLREKVAEINAQKHLVRKLPGTGQNAGWIAQAKAMPPVVTHY